MPPSRLAIVPLVAAIMLEQSNEWGVRRHHMPLETLKASGDTDLVNLPDGVG